MGGQGENSQTHGSDIRPQQVENAVTFLSHPKVRGSTESSKRSFLVGKGLTEAEISEAFRRVEASTSPSEIPTETAIPLQTKQEPGGYSWTSVFLGLGFTAAAVYSIKNLFGPSISNTVQSWRSNTTEKEPLDRNEGEGELAKAVREQTEQMRLSLESLENFIRSQSVVGTQTEDSISQLRDEVRYLAEKLDQTADEVESKKSPVSYMEVLEMLEKGETPPGIRDDINDKPPDPTMSPPISKLEPVPKPWQHEKYQSFVTDSEDLHSEGGSTTPSRRDLSGERANSIYKSIGSTPDKSPSVLIEKDYAKENATTSDEKYTLDASMKVDGSLGRKMMKNWRPPPLPTPSISSPDASSVVE